MIITKKIINDIFNLKKKILGKDKIYLSQYQEFIPMYDIYSQQIYPIKKNNLHYRLINSHYRFINDEIRDWIRNKYDEYNKKKDKKNKHLSIILKKNLDIIDNYDLQILINTSYKTLYEFSAVLGLQISICKRKSFHPFVKHLKPYYSKNELIKLGENMKLIDANEIKLEVLHEKIVHYKLCKKISSNDVSYSEIKHSTEEIINDNILSWITFYSYFGSFLFNKTLRRNNTFNTFLYNGLNKIIKTIKNSKELKSNYIVYRFIWDDSFIKNIDINDYFIDQGFISTTRDPFYNPGLDGDFGLILIKIHLPKNIKGIGLFIENLSLFPNEEEFLLPPYSKFKLISKDTNFKYFHTNPQFEELINTKYELEYINTDYNKLLSYKVKNNIKIIDLKTYEPCGETRLNIINNFIDKYDQINFEINNKIYELYFMWFDGTVNSSYSKLYVNKIKDGIIFSIYDNGYPYLNIEVGTELNINFLNLYYFYKNNKKEIDEDTLEIILHFGRIFYFSTAKIYHTYRNFSNFIDNYDIDSNLFLYNNFYNHTIYDYIKNNIKQFNNNEYIKYELGWYNLDKVLNKKVSIELITKYKLKYNTVKENLIDIIENNFSIYDYFINELNNTDLIKILDNKINLLKKNYFIFDVYNKLIYDYKDIKFRGNIRYVDELDKGEDYKNIFKQPIRRY